MIIKTGNFRKMGKVISASMENGNQYYESMFLDFQKSMAHFVNSSYSGRFSFVWESENGETPLDNIYVNTVTFMAICEAYEQVYLNSENEIFVGEEKFTIPSFKESFEESDYDSVNYSKSCIPIDSEFKQAIVEASHFAGKEDSKNGVVITGNSIVSTDRYKIYENNFENNEENEPINYPLTMIPLLGMAENFLVFLGEDPLGKVGKLLIVAYMGEEKFFEIQGREVDLLAPNVKSENFISKYNSSTYITFKKVDMISVLKFLSPFVKASVNERTYIQIDSNNKLSLQARDEIKATRLIDLIECSPEIVGSNVWVKRSDFETAISCLDGDIIKLRIDDTRKEDCKPAFDVSGSGTKHVCFARMV